jgi:methionine-rich copper-binding protein CopC
MGEEYMTLEFEEAVKALDEYIEILKQELLSMSRDQEQDNNNNNTTHIITVKRKLDRAVQERMKLSQIYCRPIVASS